MNSGAWCPAQQISQDVIEYLEINLNSLHIITDVATQGRFGNGQGLEYAEEYMLEYWRPGLSKWIRYKNALGQEVCILSHYAFYYLFVIFLFMLQQFCLH